MPEKVMNATVKQQLIALCDQLKKAGAEMQPITTDQVASIIVRSILIETGSEQACDIIPTAAERASDEDKKAAKEQRAELANAISFLITASSNVDKFLRKDGKYLPEKPTTAAVPEFA